MHKCENQALGAPDTYSAAQKKCKDPAAKDAAKQAMRSCMMAEFQKMNSNAKAMSPEDQKKMAKWDEMSEKEKQDMAKKKVIEVLNCQLKALS